LAAICHLCADSANRFNTGIKSTVEPLAEGLSRTQIGAGSGEFDRQFDRALDPLGAAVFA
jgi:hypothetical protein